MQVMNQNMNAKHLFVCYVVIPSKLTKLVPMGVKTKPSSQNKSVKQSIGTIYITLLLNYFNYSTPKTQVCVSTPPQVESCTAHSAQNQR